jgi:DNA polymerase
MSREPRQEAADIARSLRRKLERERAAGLGDLIERGARSKGTGKTSTMTLRTDATSSPRAASAVAAPPARTLEPRAPERTPAPGAVAAVAAPSDPEVDLFGRAVPKAPVQEDAPAPRLAEALLNPGGWDQRIEIAEGAAPLLAAIAAEVRACQQCALWEGRNQAVPGVGTARSGVVFIGEAPGADEDRLGEPFVGRAGQLLDKIIDAMNREKLLPGIPLSRETVFIGNVIHCRPPENRVPLPIEVEMSSPFLMRQLDAIRPRIICCLGKTSAEFLLKTKAALGAMRGKVYRLKGAKLIVTYHPAACLRNPDYKRPVWEDMQLLAREYLSD